MYTLPSEPLPIGKVLDHGFRLFTESFSRIVPIAFLIAVVGILPNLMVPWLGSENPEDMGAVFTVLTPLLPIYLLIMVWLYGSLIYRLGAVMYDRDSSLGTSFMVGLKKMLPLLVAGLLFGLLVMVGMIALIIPGIILSLTLFFYAPLIVMDDEPIFSSLSRSHKLVWGNWWRTAAVFSIPLLIFMGLLAMAGLVIAVTQGAMVGAELSMETIDWIAQMVNFVVTIFLAPLFYAIMMAQYHDLKLRKEGMDLEQRLAEKDDQLVA